MELEKTLIELIKIPSLSTHERTLADHIFTSLLVAGLKPVKQAGNIVVSVHGKDRGKGVIFDAHMDTISPGIISRWNCPPYGKDAGVKGGGKIFGLGASDNKCSISVLMNLAQELGRKTPEIDVWMVFACEEETGGGGTKRFLEWFQARGLLEKYGELSAVICEPTGMDEVQLGHRGNFNALITVKGKSGHSSEHSDKEHQAIFETMKIISALEKLERDWKKEFSDKTLGHPSISITSINGGEFGSPNKFPDSCSITIDVRTTKKLNKVAFDAVKKCVSKFKAEVKIIYTPAPTGYTSPDAKIALLGQQLVGKIGISKVSTDLCFFSELEIPGIILGPGTPDVVHKPNEYCEIKKMKKGLRTYTKLIALLSK